MPPILALSLAALLFVMGIYAFVKWKALADQLRDRAKELGLRIGRLHAIEPVRKSYLPGQEVDTGLILSISLGKVDPRHGLKNFARNGDGPRCRGRVQQRCDARRLESQTSFVSVHSVSRRL